MPTAFARIATAAFMVASLLVIQGCQKDKTYSGGCLSGAKDCKVSSPCTDVKFTCPATGALDVHVLADGDARPGGPDAVASRGDILLTNGRVTAVIAGLGNTYYLDPNGGSLLDLVTNGDDNDGINQMLQVVGILPGDAVHYDSFEIIKEADRVAVQFKGALDGQRGVPVATIYEMRACDPGVRVRTEIVNTTPDAQFWTLTDGYYWSGKEMLPFTPEPGGGFIHPSFGLTTINAAFKPFPYLAESTHVAPFASYATVGCNLKQLEGFNSSSISSAGVPRQIVSPRDYLVFERFIAVTNGKGASGAADVAQDIRKQLFNESYVTLTGKVQRPGALALDDERETSILILEGKAGDQASARVPWTQVVPQADGTFSARVPAGKDYLVEVHAFGTKQAERDLGHVTADTALDPFVLPSTARINATVLNADTGQPMNAELFLAPADDATRSAVAGSFHGMFNQCAPWLGVPTGASPACNRVLTSDTGPVVFDAPVGRFHVYATRGPFWSMDRQTVTLTPSTSELTFHLKALPLQPGGTVSADLHVHGAASFDSALPDLDRVRSFAAADVQVIAATDHDVVHDYGQVVRSLGLENQMSTITGVETTGHIPFLYVPGYGFPLVIGHYNFWPLRYDPSAPRSGAPWDELQEPGQLFDAMDDRWAGNVPVIELNHPWSEPEFGRDLGFPRAIFLDLRKNLPAADDGTHNGVYVRANNSRHFNNGHDAQEVMNSSNNTQYLQYRAFWFYLLNQGQLKTGTANSDSHSLVDATLGTPRNVVYTNTQAGLGFDVDRFNTSIKAGTVLGTNGPIIEATVDSDHGPVSFGLTPFKPAANAKLHLKVSAAPWVPVQEIRIVVNGQVVKTLAPTNQPTDPFGTDGLVRFEGDLLLSDLVSGTNDAWLVIEAGNKLLLAGDLGGGIDDGPDGMVDTTDNNGDGKVDQADVAPGQLFGPLKDPPLPTSDTDPLFHFSVVTDGVPASFTNPFVMDRNGNGKFDAPGVARGN